MKQRTQNNFGASLEARLAAERPQCSVSSGFTDRVMESLPARPEFSARRRFQRSPWGRFLVAVAAACAAVVASRVYWQRPSRPAAEIAFQSTTVKLPELSVAQVESWTTKLDEPLQKELQNVISDTRQAIHFVASNFLPEN